MSQSEPTPESFKRLARRVEELESRANDLEVRVRRVRGEVEDALTKLAAKVTQLDQAAARRLKALEAAVAALQRPRPFGR